MAILRSRFEDTNREDLSFTNWEDLSFLEQPLCVPQDPIKDLEWYHDFGENTIALDGFGFLDDIPYQKNTQNCTENDVASSQNKGYEDDGVLFQNHETNQQNRGTLFENKPVPSEWLESDIQKNREERCFLDYSCSAEKKPRSRKRICGSAWLKCAADFVKHVRKQRYRCSHCKSEETALWRNGPLEPRTLCNACGVRYKSGRLMADYRAAASPTLDAKRHSNFHERRIIMRKTA